MEIASLVLVMLLRQKTVAPLLLLCSSLAAANGVDKDSQWQSHASIQKAAEQAVHAELGDGGRIQAKAGELDHRLRLNPCEAALAGEVTGGNPRGRKRVSVLVKCPSPRPWKIHVAVQLTVFEPVVVAARPLTRGQTLKEGDIILTERETGQLEYGYLTRVEDALGMALRRPLSQGDTLSPGVLDAPVLVQRGQNVTLVVKSGGLNVSVNGVAMEAGGAGDVINVQNLSSKRQVQAVVRSEKSVEVLLN